ncbi:MAG: ABC transporter permease [Planctomycetota bacterium]|nr:MAG: ABC transporter permease [Planctomycetota bacterium]
MRCAMNKTVSRSGLLSALWRKEWQLLVRDPRALGLLILLPLVFILVLGVLLGEGFGRKADDRVRMSVVDLDSGLDFEGKSWGHWVREDLRQTQDIVLEMLPDLETAEKLVASHQRAAVLVIGGDFTRKIQNCSFLSDGINPFIRDGVAMARVDTRMIKDPRQIATAGIMEQVAQVSLLRVVLPYMIGKAFERLSDPDFIDILARNVNLPVPPTLKIVLRKEVVTLSELLAMASVGNAELERELRRKAGIGVQKSITTQFSRYNLLGKTWATLTRSQGAGVAQESVYVDEAGHGLFNRGAARYQLLVPSYTVLFSFLLVMLVGSVVVAERREGTWQRLRLAPLTPGLLLAGKGLPVLAISVAQGGLLLLAGKVVFGMRFGPDDMALAQQVAQLVPVVFCVSLAATGLALLAATMARTELQVALFGVLPALVLSLLGGCVLPTELFPESSRWIASCTPQGWALLAYRELLDPDPSSLPSLATVGRGCLALCGFAAVFFLGAWWNLRRAWHGRPG